MTARPGRARTETSEPDKTRSTPKFTVLENALSREPESEAAACACRCLIKAYAADPDAFPKDLIVRVALDHALGAFRLDDTLSPT